MDVTEPTPSPLTLRAPQAKPLGQANTCGQNPRAGRVVPVPGELREAQGAGSGPAQSILQQPGLSQ